MTVEILDAGALRRVAVGDDLLRLRVRGLGAAYVLTLDARTIPNPTRGALEATARAPRLGPPVAADAVLWAPMPPRLQDHADITVVNLSACGGVLPGTHARWTDPLNRNGTADAERRIGRLLRALARDLRQFAAPAARLALATDLDAPGAVRMVPVSDGPALTLGGPRLTVARVAGPGAPLVETIVTDQGLGRRQVIEPISVDLTFTITGTARSATELLSLMAAVATFIARTRWLELRAFPLNPASPLLRWDLDAETALTAEVTGGVHLFRACVRVRDVALPWASPTDTAAG